jgi:hypothetical protein
MKNVFSLLSIAFLALPGAVAYAGPTLINDTAATVCYANDGSGMPLATCAGSGQDGAYGRDVRANKPGNGDAGFRFARICNSGQEAGTGTCPKTPIQGLAPDQWGCTLDKVSGLTWELKTTDGSDRDMNQVFSYVDTTGVGLTGALTYVSNLSATRLCSFGDWRVPSFMELLTLFHYGIAAPDPRIDPAFFPHTPNDGMPTWSSTPFTFDGFYLRQVGFGSGVDSYAQSSAFPGRVRAVRGVPLSTVQRFKTVPSGGLKDPLTGLVWRRCTEGTQWDGVDCVGMPMLVDWAGALALAANAGSNWRLPSMAELSTLLRPTANSSCLLLKPTFPVYEPLWSNTPATDGTSVWVTDHQVGSCTPRELRPMTELGEVRLVRSY